MRSDGRNFNQIRLIKLQYDVFGYADASVLFEVGGTRVLASVSLQQSVPLFMKGHRTGWLSAEYAMLPCATHHRTVRETNTFQRNSRSVEISRLIGRCLRSIVDLEVLGEQSIIIDCDVLQADGGTRVAAITAASFALKLADQRWQECGILKKSVVKELIAAVCVGVIRGENFVDLNYLEDKDADADFNFVISQSGNLIEIQGTSEKQPMKWDIFDQIRLLALNAVKEIFKACLEITPPHKILQKRSIGSQNFSNSSLKKVLNTDSKSDMFSLINRLHKF